MSLAVITNDEIASCLYYTFICLHFVIITIYNAISEEMWCYTDKTIFLSQVFKNLQVYPIQIYAYQETNCLCLYILYSRCIPTFYLRMLQWIISQNNNTKHWNQISFNILTFRMGSNFFACNDETEWYFIRYSKLLIRASPKTTLTNSGHVLSVLLLQQPWHSRCGYWIPQHRYTCYAYTRPPSKDN